jgi:hypothetical protein
LKTAARYKKGDEMLEPYEGKLSRTVLRGLETGNGLRLLGRASKHKKESIITGHLKRMLRREH